MTISTCAVAQDTPDAQHLGSEDADSDEELWYDANGSPQVFGRELAQVHRHYVGRETCRKKEAGMNSTIFSHHA